MCGIIGISNLENASIDVFKGLLMLQHRGQDSAGILTYDEETNRFNLVKNLGFVSQVFKEEDLQNLKGKWGIGHTRYSTIGKIDKNDIQPMIENFPYGTGAVHNGNIENYLEIKNEVEATSRYLLTKNDLEVLMHYFAQGLLKYNQNDFFQTVKKSVSDIFQKFKGGYSYLSLIAGRGMVAFCDPKGIRPLILGKKEESYIFVSESNVLSFLGYEFVRDLKPGEIVYIDENNNFYSEVITQNQKASACMFEWVYFSSAESTWKNKNMYQVRLNLGNHLAEKIKDLNLEIDIVSPVPDTSRSAGIGLAETLNLPYREVLIKNRYVQRSFILNTQEKRKEAVNIKFSVVRELVEGKNILLVDDSIVRGTTSRKIVDLLRSYGANKIYMASTCPPITNPCFYGIAFPSKEELVMGQKTCDELAIELNADGVIFTDINDLKKSIDTDELCLGCLTGDYPYERTNL